jgi:hypothetical protein
MFVCILLLKKKSVHYFHFVKNKLSCFLIILLSQNMPAFLFLLLLPVLMLKYSICGVVLVLSVQNYGNYCISLSLQPKYHNLHSTPFKPSSSLGSLPMIHQGIVTEVWVVSLGLRISELLGLPRHLVYFFLYFF